MNMKLIKSIEKLVEDAEKEYNSILESSSDLKEIDRAEKNYLDTLKVLKKFNELNSYKRK
jgi:uncharacterized membrane protein YjjP (DUF1212 family)